VASGVNRYSRFLATVDHKGFDPGQCWPWLGAGKGNGYGNVTHERQQYPAHRLAFELFCAPIPDGMDVCHTCDNRWCVNPDHLFVGDRQANMADCKHKGRTDGGRRKHLNEKTVQEIQRRLNAGVAPQTVAASLDVNYGTVTAIQRGKSYGRKR
jgi:hypothetical protein